jgi:hypothetical protein
VLLKEFRGGLLIQRRDKFSMPRRSIALLSCEGMHSNRASCPYDEANPTMLTLVHGDGEPSEVRHLRNARPAALDMARRPNLLRVPFDRGEVQLAARGVDLTLDITAKHFDVTGHLRLEHACGTLTRVEAQHLVAALVAFLARTPGRSGSCMMPPFHSQRDMMASRL